MSSQQSTNGGKATKYVTKSTQNIAEKGNQHLKKSELCLSTIPLTEKIEKIHEENNGENLTLENSAKETKNKKWVIKVEKQKNSEPDTCNLFLKSISFIA